MASDAYKACGITTPKFYYSDNIRDTDVRPESAASLLVVPNPVARKIINFKLNNIHLCKSMEELHEHSQGGITIDGYRSTGHSMYKMKMSEINYTLGSQAKRLELDRQRSLADRKQAEKNAAEDVIRTLEALRSRLTAFDFGKDYRFESIAENRSSPPVSPSAESPWPSLPPTRPISLCKRPWSLQSRSLTQPIPECRE